MKWINSHETQEDAEKAFNKGWTISKKYPQLKWRVKRLDQTILVDFKLNDLLNRSYQFTGSKWQIYSRGYPDIPRVWDSILWRTLKGIRP